MERFTHRVTVDTGTEVRWVSVPTVSVFDSGTSNYSSIYDDDGVTPKANPFQGPTTGLIYFYAPDGLYDVVFSGGTPTVSYTIGAVLLDDTLSLLSGGTGITSLNGITNSVQGLSVGMSGSDFNIASYGSGHTFNLPTASSTARGALSTSDWSAFSAKLESINGLTVVAQTLTIGSSGSSPSWLSTGSSHQLNLPTASASKSGILSNTDFQTFANKQDTLSGGTSSQYLRGDGVFATLNTDAVTEATNLYYTNARARLALSATAPVTYNNVTGVIAANPATVAQNGYLTSTDWNTFNNKLGTLNTLTTATQSFSASSAGSDFDIASAGSTHVFKIPSASSSNRGLVTTGPQTFEGPKTFSREIFVPQYLEFTEISALPNGPSDTARLYIKDNGSGKTQLCVVFSSGAVQVIATQP